ncbi:hypothetical protein KZO25_17270 [Halomonas sp. ANAO-440]|uniref:DUF6447 family protein n=1 Tax=Halomonas sp. ANAO-440 TaxID=2861360 RepID=UPI001CAA80AA|nr:DUF6447 family protein [Halomonas sp. ANAO-440]MBZ0332069.1 hypothetical protein [Halomonas sp. ANAO-440]
MADQKPQTVTIDGQAYSLDALSENAKQQMANLRVTDTEIEKLKQQLAIYQTARTAYARALAAELPSNED